jgi:hypothetical protein
MIATTAITAGVKLGTMYTLTKNAINIKRSDGKKNSIVLLYTLLFL